MIYGEFLRGKKICDAPTGLKSIPDMHHGMFDFQRDIAAWALKRGRASIFADCGMGKTLMQLSWADKTPGRALILAPLAVAKQTVDEGAKFDIDATYSRDGNPSTGKITITNYELLHRFDVSKFDSIVLDESSILKNYSGKIRNMIIDSFRDTKYRLACTATPAPNDFMELGNHSEFCGTMSRTEMLSMFFVHDGGETQKWRLKGHATSPFWEWLCSWAVMIRKPSDLGYDDDGFILPDMEIHQHTVKSTHPREGMLFTMEAQTLQERQQERKLSIDDRVALCAEIVSEKPNEPWVIWCNLNEESEKIKKAINGSVEVRGSDNPEKKEEMLNGFSSGQFQVMVTKPSVAGFGMNWQHCSNVAFVGLSDSYEQFYQALRRCWRFGQKNKVNAHVITSEAEGAVVRNIQRKESDAMAMAAEMVKHMGHINSMDIRGTSRNFTGYDPQTAMTVPAFLRGAK